MSICTTPISVEDITDCLNILGIAINDTILTISRAATTTESRECEVCRHNICYAAIDKHTFFVGQCKTRIGGLCLNSGSSQAVQRLCWSSTAIWVCFKHHTDINSSMCGLF